MTEVMFDFRCEEKIDENIIKALENIIDYTLKAEEFNKETQVSVSFVGEEEIKELNKIYRNKDNVTDVLSFPMDEDEDEDGIVILGDVVLCVKRALEQANEFNHSFEREICYLTVHSILHLLGYDHMNEDEKRQMREHEERIMTDFNITR